MTKGIFSGTPLRNPLGSSPESLSRLKTRRESSRLALSAAPSAAARAQQEALLPRSVPARQAPREITRRRVSKRYKTGLLLSAIVLPLTVAFALMLGASVRGAETPAEAEPPSVASDNASSDTHALTVGEMQVSPPAQAAPTVLPTPAVTIQPALVGTATKTAILPGKSPTRGSIRQATLTPVLSRGPIQTATATRTRTPIPTATRPPAPTATRLPPTLYPTGGPPPPPGTCILGCD